MDCLKNSYIQDQQKLWKKKHSKKFSPNIKYLLQEKSNLAEIGFELIEASRSHINERVRYIACHLKPHCWNRHATEFATFMVIVLAKNLPYYRLKISQEVD